MSLRFEPPSNSDGILPLGLLHNFLGVLLGFVRVDRWVWITRQLIQNDGRDV